MHLISNYTLIEANNHLVLSMRVVEALRDGWDLWGNPFEAGPPGETRLYQAVVAFVGPEQSVTSFGDKVSS
jgi:hypothetical protein